MDHRETKGYWLVCVDVVRSSNRELLGNTRLICFVTRDRYRGCVQDWRD